MTETPMLFSGPMVAALVENRKTQTRRQLTRQPPFEVRGGEPTGVNNVWILHGGDLQTAPVKCPRAVGDIIWVKEKYRLPIGYDRLKPSVYPFGSPVYFPGASEDPPPEPKLGEWVWGKLRPAIHMPRAICRIRRRVSKIRVEALKRISEADALAEGIIEYEADREEGGDPAEYAWDPVRGRGEVFPTARAAYCDLWCAINGRTSWNANPAVWVYELEPVE